MPQISYGRGPLKRFYDHAPLPLQNAMATLYGMRLSRQAYGQVYRRHYARLQESQWFTPAQLDELQQRELRAFLQYAGRHSAYWRETFLQYGVEARVVRSAAELCRLPLLDKETVRQRGADLLAGPARDGQIPVVVVHTSGTTGKGLRIVLTREAWQREYAFRSLHRSWGRIQRGDRTATFAGHPVVPADQTDPPFWRYNRAERQLLFSAQHMSAAKLGSYVERLRRFDPVLIHGYPSAIYLLASYIEAERVEGVRPRAVFTHSETLLDEQRRTIQRAFACKVFNWYGTTEHAGNIVECERGSLHVKREHSLLEFLRPDGSAAGPGELAELVCTSHANWAMPLIRYRLGDTVRLAGGACPCGRSGPLIERIIGRIEDYIVTPDGRHVGRLDHVFKKSLNVFEAQLLQESLDALHVRIVPREGFSEGDRAAIEQELRDRLGRAIRLDFQFLREIPRGPNGKFRFAVSKLPLGMAGTTAGAGGDG